MRTGVDVSWFAAVTLDDSSFIVFCILRLVPRIEVDISRRDIVSFCWRLRWHSHVSMQAPFHFVPLGHMHPS